MDWLKDVQTNLKQIEAEEDGWMGAEKMNQITEKWAQNRGDSTADLHCLASEGRKATNLETEKAEKKKTLFTLDLITSSNPTLISTNHNLTSPKHSLAIY